MSTFCVKQRSNMAVSACSLSLGSWLLSSTRSPSTQKPRTLLLCVMSGVLSKDLLSRSCCGARFLRPLRSQLSMACGPGNRIVNQVISALTPSDSERTLQRSFVIKSMRSRTDVWQWLQVSCKECIVWHDDYHHDAEVDQQYFSIMALCKLDCQWSLTLSFCNFQLAVLFTMHCSRIRICSNKFQMEHFSSSSY